MTDENLKEKESSPRREDEQSKKTESDVIVDPSAIDVPSELAVLPLRGFVFFPGMGFPLQITNTASKQLIDDAVLADRLIAVVSYKEEEGKDDIPDKDKLFQVGVMGYIHKLIKVEEGFYQVLMGAVKRVRVLDFSQESPYLRARVKSLAMVDGEGRKIEALLLNLKTQFSRLVEQTKAPQELQMTISSLKNPFHVAYLISSQLNMSLTEEQEVLEIVDLMPLLERVTVELNKRLETVEMSNEIQKNIKEDIDGKQKEFFLRQQMKAIKKELGDDEGNVELDELIKRIAVADLGEEAQATAEKELARLQRISPSSPEYTVSRNYLEWILDLPWQTATVDSLDLEKAQENMDEDHYGLDKIKKRILEFLAVRKLNADIHGPILCFVGPPGVGKTSLGQSIARTMGKKFIRISLGGVRDEAEIRGHRRTYIGALPGRIIQSLKKAGANNPLFMLDEVDKLGTDFRGDPSSALLEVLDPEQNSTFADHYLEIAFDLSKVMFITTANYIDNIPGPLRDRMEIIELSSYTEDEKLMIAKRHLVGKQLSNHSLTEDDLSFEDDSIRTIIRSYTREAGVRNLEQKIAAVCRGVAKNIVGGTEYEKTINAADIANYLGPLQFFPEKTARTWGPGVATGLAWTPVGGVLLFIEAAKMPGRGGLTLTGKLGDVMKESASAALTYIRSHAAELKIDDDIFAKTDIHVHVPEGAVPKDGPSAGVAMVCSLTSLLTGKLVNKNLAMTGEITLRGDVLPVGGVKEKVLAAVRAGIEEIILPYLNKKDVVEIPAEVKKGIKFHFVQDINQSLQIAMKKGKGKSLKA